MANCNLSHRDDPFFGQLPKDQGDFGRHKCAGCAYTLGYQMGLEKRTNINIAEAVSGIDKSQAREVRHKSPHLAFALGYADGLRKYYEANPSQDN